MRSGQVVGGQGSGAWNSTTLVQAMLGADPVVDQPRAQRSAASSGPPALQVSGLQAAGVSVTDLTVERGEIVGLAGLVGSGRTELLRALAGADRVNAGTMRRDGREVSWPRSPRAALRARIALAPEDRKTQGLVLNQNAAWNIALGRLGAAARRGLLRRAKLKAVTEPHATVVGFAPERLAAAAGTLSGGNQQKLLLARWLHKPVDVLLLDEPTRGIDIGAKAEVFASMRRIAAQGRSVIWVSSELDEIVAHSDRVVVIAAGTVVADLGAHATESDILELSFGAQSRAETPPTAQGSGQ
jgi:ribose transport system ATP-binding protein